MSDNNNQNKIGPKVSINYNEPDLDNYFTPEQININFYNYEEKESIDINFKQNNFFQTENNKSKKLTSSIMVSQNDKNKNKGFYCCCNTKKKVKSKQDLSFNSNNKYSFKSTKVINDSIIKYKQKKSCNNTQVTYATESNKKKKKEFRAMCMYYCLMFNLYNNNL